MLFVVTLRNKEGLNVSKLERIMASTTIIENIAKLVQVESGDPRKCAAGKAMAKLECIDNAFLLMKDGKISDFGPMDKAPQAGFTTRIDAKGGMVLPSYCDSHTHLVYAGSREIEYIDKIRGLSYEEIAKRGGGIINSAKRLHESSEDSLYESAMARIEEITQRGTGAVEIKSGYGLNTEDELKMLRVIRRIRETSKLTVKANFLGAHAVPLEYKGRQGEYVDLIINEMIPRVAGEGLADFIDVFCDEGFFTVEETERMLMQGIKYGLKPKIHANELAPSGGIQIGVKYGALSVDHLEHTGDAEIAALLGSETMPTLLPGAAFFLGMENPPARKMIDAGLPIALASDYNPGSSPSGDMKFIVSLGCIKLRLLPEESINATTINSAYAMGISDTHGSICRGKDANVYITKPIPSYEYIPYAYTARLVDRTFINGQEV